MSITFDPAFTDWSSLTGLVECTTVEEANQLLQTEGGFVLGAGTDDDGALAFIIGYFQSSDAAPAVPETESTTPAEPPPASAAAVADPVHDNSSVVGVGVTPGTFTPPAPAAGQA